MKQRKNIDDLSVRKMIGVLLVLGILFVFGCSAPEIQQDDLNDSFEADNLEIGESEEPESVEVVVKQVVANDIEDEVSVQEVEESAPKRHVVEIGKKGFTPALLDIKVGDTVEWKNVRTGSLNKAMIVGTQACRDVKSEIYGSDESFEWTFNEVQKCTIVDGYTTTQTSKVIVS